MSRVDPWRDCLLAVDAAAVDVRLLILRNRRNPRRNYKRQCSFLGRHSSDGPFKRIVEPIWSSLFFQTFFSVFIVDPAFLRIGQSLEIRDRRTRPFVSVGLLRKQRLDLGNVLALWDHLCFYRDVILSLRFDRFFWFVSRWLNEEDWESDRNHD